MIRATAYRLVKRVMYRANIKGAQAQVRGYAMGPGHRSQQRKPVPIHVTSKLMGHSDNKTTEIYLHSCTTFTLFYC